MNKRPIYDLILTTPSSAVSFRDGSIKIKVKVKVVVKSSIVGSSGVVGTLNAACEHKSVSKFVRSSRIVDEVVFDIDFKNDLGLSEISEAQKFNFVVNFIDDATNKTFNASTKFTVEISDFMISIVHSPQYFKPGIPYSFTLLVAKINGNPVINSAFPVEVNVADDQGNSLLRRDYSLNSMTGGVEVEVSGISLTAKYWIIKAKYDQVRYTQTVYRAPSKQKNFVSLNVLTPR